MGIYYLGAFPPEYGGVTIKNKNLFEALENKIEISKVDFNLIKRKNIKEAFRLFIILLGRNNRFVIGIAGRQTRKRFTQLLYYMNRKAMNNSLIFLMGGTAANDIVSDPEYLKCAREYKMIYAETQGMIKTLETAGLRNAGYYPNGRFRSKHQIRERKKNEKLRCVFFSTISIQKGADIVLKTARNLPDIFFAFYGSVDREYQSEFKHIVEELGNVKYYGVFTGDTESVYQELSKYDVLLLPTKWKAEGIPGILVEAKIAGLAEVVSNQNYNAEIVRDKEDGIVLQNNDARDLETILKVLEKDKNFLQYLKQGSMLSAERFYLENYIESILGILSEGIDGSERWG